MSAELVRKLVATDDLHAWGQVAYQVSGSERKAAFAEAVPLWTLRMISEWRLLLHPSVIEQLRDQGWQPNELQQQMIWASIVCKLEMPAQKEEKAQIRTLIWKRNGRDGWEAVYQRAGKVWPAWDRAKKRVFAHGPATRLMAAHSSVLSGAFADEYQAVLRMVPST